jgi:hypothetical protein
MRRKEDGKGVGGMLALNVSIFESLRLSDLIFCNSDTAISSPFHVFAHHYRGGEKVVWVPAEDYVEPVDEKRKRKKKQSL